MTLKLRQIVLYLKELQYGTWSVTDANTFVKTEEALEVANNHIEAHDQTPRTPHPRPVWK